MVKHLVRDIVFITILFAVVFGVLQVADQIWTLPEMSGGNAGMLVIAVMYISRIGGFLQGWRTRENIFTRNAVWIMDEYIDNTKRILPESLRAAVKAAEEARYARRD